jgi:hypothetical protein
LHADAFSENFSAYVIFTSRVWVQFWVRTLVRTLLGDKSYLEQDLEKKRGGGAKGSCIRQVMLAMAPRNVNPDGRGQGGVMQRLFEREVPTSTGMLGLPIGLHYSTELL